MNNDDDADDDFDDGDNDDYAGNDNILSKLNDEWWSLLLIQPSIAHVWGE